jgi:hypothetical protein
MSGKRYAAIILMMVLQLSGSSAPCASTPPQETAGLRQSVLALDSAWNRARNDLEHKKQANILGEAERSDYARFIVFLSDRILQYCREIVALEGPSAAADLPCPDDRTMGSGTDAVPSSTTAEQVARLDGTLSEALGEFDEMLLKEERRIAARSPRERETGDGHGGSRGYGGGSRPGPVGGTGGMEDGDPGGGQAGSGGQQEGGSSGAGAPGDPGQTAGTDQGYAGGSRTGRDGSPTAGKAGTGDGQRDRGKGVPTIESGYDDIVARQLREAAEKETDPELKAKLWEEYRKYKDGLR